MTSKMWISLILLFLSATNASYLEYDGWLNIDMLHALDVGQPEKFTLRGNVTISSISTVSYTLVQEPLSAEERAKLKALAEADKFYRLKAVVKSPDGAKTTFLTSSKACALANSQLTDALWISLNHAGSVLGISQSISGSGNCRSLKHVHTDALEEFNTDIFVRQSELAPIPDTASFIQRIEREREAKERGEHKDNRGFFAKYWMYIVPVVILVLITSAANPEAGATGAAR